MPVASTLSWFLRRLVPPMLAVGFLLAAWAWPHSGDKKAPVVPMDSWDMPELVAHLNESGLELRVVPTQKGAAVHQTVFLTSTDKEWEELNGLLRIPEHIDRWRGTLYCERSRVGADWSVFTHMWGDCCLVAEPFIFFGDRELLVRVRDALTAPPSSGA